MTAAERLWVGMPESHIAAFYEHLRLRRIERQRDHYARAKAEIARIDRECRETFERTHAPILEARGRFEAAMADALGSQGGGR